MYKDTVTLSSIIKEVYQQKKLIYEDIIFDEDFEKNTKKKLKGIAKGLGIKIENYRVDKNNYKIPKIIADILTIYLTEDSKKGSFISKINNKNFDKITKEEKVEFLNKVVDNLKKKYKNDENYSEVLDSLLEVKWTIINQINFSHGGVELIDEIKKDITDKIDVCFKEFTHIKPDDGIIRVNDRIYIDKIESSKRINIDDLKFSDMNIDLLSNDDKIVFVRYLKEMIFQSIEEWNKLRKIANEIKHCKIDEAVECCDDSSEKQFDEYESIEGINLLSISIQEYKKEIIKEYEEKLENTYKKKEIISNEEIGQILEDIKKELYAKK